LKNQLERSLKAKGLSKYWKVETFRDYEFTKDIIHQLQSEKHLFSLLAGIIMAVACSNIISMLIILVNDKKLEIGILRSMGATSFSIAAIFGLSGMLMGVFGSIVGILAAIVTLKNIQTIIDFMSQLQGYEVFNPSFYGHGLSSEISIETLVFVLLATAGLSLIAGVVPAIKACLLKPSDILKTE